ncbi:hypothetical protein TYRP_018037 [Tyrophagus putrescentiae]|nr:hypothetical protein TYRP_018037 [Tyrophagus putrescentiae]
MLSRLVLSSSSMSLRMSMSREGEMRSMESMKERSVQGGLAIVATAATSTDQSSREDGVVEGVGVCIDANGH